MIGNSSATILQQLQAKTRPMAFAPGVYDFDEGTVVSGVSGDIRGGSPRGMTTINSGLEIQVSSTRRQTIRNMRFIRNDGGDDGRGLSIGPHVGLDLVQCEFANGADADDNDIYGWPCRVRMSGCIIGSTSTLGKGFLVSPNTPSNPAPQGSVSLAAHDCEFRTAGIRNPDVIDAVLFLNRCKVWRAEQTVICGTGTVGWFTDTKFYSTRHPNAASPVFNWGGLIHIHTDWSVQSGAYQSQIKPQIYIKNCTLDGIRVTRKDICRGFSRSADLYDMPCPDDSYFLPGSD